MIGIVKLTNPKGYGFLIIEGEKKDIFFHAKDLKGMEFSTIRKGDRMFLKRIETNPETGKTIAREVSLA